MPRRTKLSKVNTKQSIGAMRDRVTLQNRSIQAPLDDAPADMILDFQSSAKVWASIETTGGTAHFSGINVGDELVTHVLVIRHDDSVTQETWIETSDGSRLDIVSVESLDARRQYMRLLCVEKGSATLAASGA